MKLTVEIIKEEKARILTAYDKWLDEPFHIMKTRDLELHVKRYIEALCKHHDGIAYLPDPNF